MSKILHDAAIEALRAAHDSFMRGDTGEYKEKMQAAEDAIGAIRALGVNGENGREMELLALGAEKTLAATLPLLKYPGRLLRLYELAAVQMLIPPSRVISRNAPYLPPCDDVFAFYRVGLEQAEVLAGELTQAIALYGRLTGGGGAGTDLLFRAGLLLRRGQPKQAADLAQQAISIGREWLKRPARNLLRQAYKEETI